MTPTPGYIKSDFYENVLGFISNELLNLTSIK